MGVIAAALRSAAGSVEIAAERWRIYITANEGHTNTSIAEIVFRDWNADPISYVGGTATASTQFSGTYVPANAFDANNTSRWATTSGSAAPSWIEMDFAAPVTPKSVDLRAPPVDANDMARDFKIEYYDTVSATWIAIATYAAQTGWTGGEMRNFHIQDVEPPNAVTDDLVAQFDAKDYTSGTNWSNNVAAPADGSAQIAYDFELTGDPAITNTGADDAYWDLDGDDYFTLDSANTAFLSAMHKAGSEFTVEIWMQWAGTPSSNIAPLFDSGSSDVGGSDLSKGIIFLDLGNNVVDSQTAGRMRLRIKQDSGGTSSFNVQSDAAIPSGAVQMCAVSFKAGNTSFLYRNGAYAQVSATDTFTGTLSSPGTSDSTNRTRIGARGDGTFRVPTGTRVYLARIYNRALSKAELDQNWDATRGRYGL